MGASSRSVLTVLVLLFAGGVRAQDLRDPAQNPLAAMRAEQWADAEAAAARFADPVAEKLVLYFRLRAPGAANAAEIADFMQHNPDWPAQALLEQRRQEAIAADPDDADVLLQCAAGTPGTDRLAAALPLARPSTAAAMLRCAEALANAGRTADANEMARQAWVSTIENPSTETAFLHRWAGVPDADDQWLRFQRLAWTDTSGATRQITRLDHAHHAAAEARIAAKRDDPQAETLIDALPPDLRDDPGLMLDRARSLRREDRAADALTVWLRDGATAQRAAPAQSTEFWAERNLLTRKLLLEARKAGGGYEQAYRLVAGHGQIAGEPLLDAEFLAGFIALRLLQDPARAAVHFKALAAASPAAITQGRAHYWLARAATAQGVDARSEYAAAAAWSTTFYGQIAALSSGGAKDGSPAAIPAAQAVLLARIRNLKDPAWSQGAVLAFTEHEVVRAAAWLVAWGDSQRARAFLQRMDELAPVPAERALTAAFALQLGLPDTAVAVARRMGRDGLLLPRMGWPAPFEPPTPPDASFSLGIMRQESSFDIGAVSSSGARGLMQLMPPTATLVAKQLGVPVNIPSLTYDPSQNMRLGTAYLREVLERFDGCLPLAAAAYNAGPHRVTQWLDDNGDPRIGPVDMIDWIELIPSHETRNYVQRVIENALIYRAKSGNAAPILNIPWTR
jgi:soluble lytic murein transglycosylase